MESSSDPISPSPSPYSSFSPPPHLHIVWPLSCCLETSPLTTSKSVTQNFSSPPPQKNIDPTNIGDFSDASKVSLRYFEVKIVALVSINVRSLPHHFYLTMRGWTDPWMLPRRCLRNIWSGVPFFGGVGWAGGGGR